MEWKIFIHHASLLGIFRSIHPCTGETTLRVILITILIIIMIIIKIMIKVSQSPYIRSFQYNSANETPNGELCKRITISFLCAQ